MAQRVNIILEDDMDGSAADSTISFALDGQTYEIDLSTKNADKLRKALKPFVESARKVSSRRLAARKNGGPAPADVRAWAKSNGYDVPDRGRIPQEVRDAYTAAN